MEFADEFVSGLPAYCRCTEDSLVLDDGSEFELYALPADEEFPQVVANSCPKLPTQDERDSIDDYRVNICLTGRGGSIAAAKQLIRAAAAVLTAGGAGVFVDNSGIAHGAADWHALERSSDDGGVYWAFVMTVRGEGILYTLGMQILGFRDAMIPSTGDEELDHRALHSFLGFTAFSGATPNDGDLITDPVLPTFRAHVQPDDLLPSDAPMYNPFGRWRLEPMDVERN